jgi:hypothetical protein
MTHVKFTFQWYIPSKFKAPDLSVCACRSAADVDDVYVTGTFDNWSHTTKLYRTDSGHFEREIHLPVNEKVFYKVNPPSLIPRGTCAVI